MHRRSVPTASVRLMVCLLGLATLTGCGGSAPPPDAPAVTSSPTPVATYPPALGGSRAAAGSTASADSTGSTGATSSTGSTPAAAVPTLAAATSGPHALQDPLRLQFKQGEQRRYTETLRLSMDVPVLPLGQRAPATTIDLSFKYEVLDVAGDGSARVRSTIERVSGPEAAGGLASDFIAGTSLTARVGTDGVVSDALVERAGQIVASGSQADRGANSMLLFPYLNSPLLIGDSSQGRQSVSLGQGMPDVAMEIRYTLAEISKRDGVEVARIDELADMPQIALASPAPGIEFRNGKGNLKGSVLVSTADGWPVAGDSKTTMSFDLRGADPRLSGTVTVRVDQHFQLERFLKAS